MIEYLNFGKYKGQKILNIAIEDPNYIVWLSENNIIEIDGDILSSCLHDTMAPDWEDLNSDWGNRD